MLATTKSALMKWKPSIYADGLLISMVGFPGDGKDTIIVGNMLRSLVHAGAGNDNVNIRFMYKSLVKGDMGNDTIVVQSATDSSYITGDYFSREGTRWAVTAGVVAALWSMGIIGGEQAVIGGGGAEAAWGIDWQALYYMMPSGESEDPDLKDNKKTEFDDIISIGLLRDSMVDGAFGHDVVRVQKAENSFVWGGAGSDEIYVNDIKDTWVFGDALFTKNSPSPKQMMT